VTQIHNLNSIVIQFDRGTVTVEANNFTDISKQFPWLVWDKRTGTYRCHAIYYRHLITYFHRNGLNYTDIEPKYSNLELTLSTTFTPHSFQQEAFKAWQLPKRGIAVLPTGTGKSFLAAMIMERVQRSALIIAPTIDLILQWQKNLQDLFQIPIGLLGGGSHEIKDITVTTYESAKIYAETIGHQFCLLIFDECHHLPSPAHSEMARAYIAPYRLGLTATPNIEPDRQLLLEELVGKELYTKDIQQLSGEFLSPYRIETIEVDLTQKEREEFEYHRKIYRDYRDKTVGSLGGQRAWERFVMYCYRTPEGRGALKSFSIQKQLAISAQGKFVELAEILIRHSQERILIFTNDNRTAYLISSLFLLPLITHETKARERKLILENFRNGTWPFVVNSRVLNEGVDVPEANVAVIISGTSTVREHVQRLGRILRRQGDKTAILYELVTVDTGEVFASRRRREHGAYEQFS